MSSSTLFQSEMALEKVMLGVGNQVRLWLVSGDQIDGQVLEADERNITLRVNRIYDPLLTVDKRKIVLHRNLIRTAMKF